MSKYDIWQSEENLQKLREMVNNGLSKNDIAEKIGISKTTLYSWCKKNNQIEQILSNISVKKNDSSTKGESQKLSPNITLKNNKIQDCVNDKDVKKYITSVMKDLQENMKGGDVSSAVEYSLLKRALGYDYTEERTEYTEKSGEKTVVTQKHAPPDTTAQMLWLKNHKPDIWKEKKDNNEDKIFEIKISVIDGGVTNGD